MRIALVSDIHGNLAALQAVVDDFGRRGVDAVINLGDSLSGPLLPLETARFLMAQDWLHLAGNHERQILNLRADACDPSDAYARQQLGVAGLPGLARWHLSIATAKRFSCVTARPATTPNTFWSRRNPAACARQLRQKWSSAWVRPPPGSSPAATRMCRAWCVRPAGRCW